uniref:Glutaredoxin protein n=1 Tax=Solanum rostratum TaxID=45839 RepID=A0A411P8T7_SOLRO|nr:glutaredoxin protein [Solanum rostratum]
MLLRLPTITPKSHIQGLRKRMLKPL